MRGCGAPAPAGLKFLCLPAMAVLLLLALSCGGDDAGSGAAPEWQFQIATPAPGAKIRFPFPANGSKSAGIDTLIVTGFGEPIIYPLGDGVLWSVTLSNHGVLGQANLVFHARAAGALVAAITQTVESVLEYTGDATNHISDPYFNYYVDVYGYQGAALKAALHAKLRGHTVIPYGSGTTGNNNVWNALKVLDADPANPANVLCIYSRHSLPKSAQDSGSGDWAVWNREHSWPKSHGFPASVAYDPYTGTPPYAMSTAVWPPYTDLHHMRAGVKMVNTHRGDLDFGTGSVLYSAGRTPPFTVPDSFKYSSLYWEPPDEVKGDIARALFYMTVRYEGGTEKEPDLELVDGTTTSSSAPHTSGQLGNLAVLRAWHLADPVSDAERLRNNLVYSIYQGNRNPFIDYPEWVTNIWP